MASILVSGGRGLVGKRLCELLVNSGHKVCVLSRSKNKSLIKGLTYSHWNPESGVINKQAVNNSEIIIHLAGENIGARRWTEARKNKIVDSRVKSAEMILDAVDKKCLKLKAFISSSAVGYYGSVTTKTIFNESHPPADDFLGTTCRLWESSADNFQDFGMRVVKLRTGVVLSKWGGVLPKLDLPVRAGFGSAIGSGNQYLPWIHIDDLCRMYLYAVENSEIEGSFNAVAPEHITMQALVRSFAKQLERPYWFPNIPSWLMKLIFGEMSAMLLEGSRIDSEKISSAGFKFSYPELKAALCDIYRKKFK